MPQLRCAALGAERTRLAAIKGDPVDVLAGASRDIGADVVLVGSYGLSTVNGVVFGSVPDGVTREADCDVMVVHTTDDRVRKLVSPRFRRRRDSSRQTVLVAVEDTTRSFRAADRAAQLAVEHDADLVLMGAREPLDFDERRIAELALKNEKHVANDVFAVDQALRRCQERAEALGVRHVERLMVKGDPASKLLALADERNAGLVVLGNHKVPGRMRSLVGSVSGYIARNTASSVLLVS